MLESNLDILDLEAGGGENQGDSRYLVSTWAEMGLGRIGEPQGSDQIDRAPEAPPGKSIVNGADCIARPLTDTQIAPSRLPTPTLDGTTNSGA